MRDRTPRPALRGPYLVRNPLGVAVLGSADAAIRLLRRRDPPGVPIATPPARVLLCNIAHLGDVVLSTALLAPLREALPEVELGFLCSRGGAAVLEGHPALRWCHTFDHWKLDRSGRPRSARVRDHVRSFAAAVRSIGDVCYDAAVDLYPYYPNAIPVLWAASVPVRVGHVSGGFGGLLTHRTRYREGADHVTEHQRRLLDLLPGHVDPGRPLRPWLPPGEDGRGGDYVVLHPGAGAPTKRWPAERWRAVAERLAAEGHTVVLTGAGDAERDANAGLAAAAGCVDATGTLSWPGFVGMIRGAAALVAADTVAGHVASAFGVPTVVVGNGIDAPGLWRPLGDRVEALVHPVPCSPCRLGRGCEGMECIREISVERVRSALGRVWS